MRCMRSTVQSPGRRQTSSIVQKKKMGGQDHLCGNTSCRTIESLGGRGRYPEGSCGWTSICIYPGYCFKVLDGLITNFHLPESTLVMLVSALAKGSISWLPMREASAREISLFSFGMQCLSARESWSRADSVRTVEHALPYGKTRKSRRLCL